MDGDGQSITTSITSYTDSTSMASMDSSPAPVPYQAFDNSTSTNNSSILDEDLKNKSDTKSLESKESGEINEFLFMSFYSGRFIE